MITAGLENNRITVRVVVWIIWWFSLNLRNLLFIDHPSEDSLLECCRGRNAHIVQCVPGMLLIVSLCGIFVNNGLCLLHIVGARTAVDVWP